MTNQPRLVADLPAAHQETAEHTEALTEASAVRPAPIDLRNAAGISAAGGRQSIHPGAGGSGW